MKMLDVGLAGIDEIEKYLTEALDSVRLLRQLIDEVNRTNNHELICQEDRDE